MAKAVRMSLFFITIVLLLCDFCAGETEKGKFYIKDNLIYRDAKPFFIKGVCYGLNYPKIEKFGQIPIEVFENDFKMMEQAGINAIRVYEPLPEFMLDLAKKHDLLVVETILSLDDGVNYGSKEELEKLKNKALEIVRRDKNKECILMWSLWNDMPFQFGIKGGNVVPRYSFNQVNSFIKEIYSAVKAEDPAHLVTASNILNVTSYQLGFDFLDVIGMNTYLGISDWFDGNFDYDIALLTAKKLDRISRDYAKPVIITETGYSSFCKGYSQQRALRAQINLAYENFAGLFIFQWADSWDKAGDNTTLDDHIEEHWGIVDGFRKPKPAYDIAAELFNKIKPNVYLNRFKPDTPGEFLNNADEKGFILEDFEYDSPAQFAKDFGKFRDDGSRCAIQLDSEQKYSGERGCMIIFQPETTNAWMRAQKDFSESADITKYKKIGFWAKGAGPAVNFSLMLKDSDNERWKTLSVLPNAEWRRYLFELDKLSIDSRDAGRDGVVRGNNYLDKDKIKGMVLQVNVIPNLEELGSKTILYIDKIELF